MCWGSGVRSHKGKNHLDWGHPLQPLYWGSSEAILWNWLSDNFENTLNRSWTCFESMWYCYGMIISYGIRIVFVSFWNNFGFLLNSFWNRFEIILRSFWDHLGINLGSFWVHFGIVLGSFLGSSGVAMGVDPPMSSVLSLEALGGVNPPQICPNVRRWSCCGPWGG